jgi:hypothetical protein
MVGGFLWILAEKESNHENNQKRRKKSFLWVDRLDLEGGLKTLCERVDEIDFHSHREKEQRDAAVNNQQGEPRLSIYPSIYLCIEK